MRSFLHTVHKVAATDSSVLILGETGVGKGRLARSIHSEGRRAAGPFVAVHCAALAESLLETELFGHEAGAFTGATRARKGYFELANGGTLFLDEIGEISSHVQVKLLKSLEEKQIQRVGAERATPIDVRVMAATHRDIEAEMATERFRPDLFYRLAVVTLTIPPLRERRADIRSLALQYLKHFQASMAKGGLNFSTEAMDLLDRYPWPGNVRELINAVERSVLMSTGRQIEIEDLPRRIVTRTVGDPAKSESNGADGIDDGSLSLTEARARAVTNFEKSFTEKMLRATGGQVGQAAKLAGINQRHLYDLMKRHGLKKED